MRCVQYVLEVQGQPLLDASLYLPSENHDSVTRPSFKESLPFPLSWTVPNKLRAAAKKRCSRLGLESLDFNSAAQDETKDEDPASQAGFIPASLQFPSAKRSLSRKATEIRFHSLIKQLLDPLHKLPGENRYILPTRRPTTLDCLAIAYLSRFLLPEVPNNFLAKTMRSEYPQLCGYVYAFPSSWLGGGSYRGRRPCREMCRP